MISVFIACVLCRASMHVSEWIEQRRAGDVAWKGGQGWWAETIEKGGVDAPNLGRQRNLAVFIKAETKPKK